MNTDGTGYGVLHQFAPVSEGTGPIPLLKQDGSILYGVASNGGSHNCGVAFSIDTSGGHYTVLHNFAGPPSDAKYPLGATMSNSTIFGMSPIGGTNDLGAVFELPLDI